MTKTVHPYHWVIVGGERLCREEAICAGQDGREENNPTVDVDGLYSVQMPNCEKKSR